MTEHDSSGDIELNPQQLIPRFLSHRSYYTSIPDDLNVPALNQNHTQECPQEFQGEFPREYPNEIRRDLLGELSKNLPKKLSTSAKYKTLAAALFSISFLLFILATLLTNRPENKLGLSLIRITAFRQVSHPEPPNSLWGNVVKPYPTGAFWTNLVVKNGDGAIGVYPYGVKTTDSGIQVSYGASRRAVSPTAITDPFVTDLQIGSIQQFVGRNIETYDNTSVTVNYRTTVNGKYKTYLVKGSPFITVVYENATPMISSTLMKIVTVDARVVKGSAGVQYILTLGNFQKWLVYCSEPVALIWRDDSLYSPNPIRGFIRVAILPVQNAEISFNILLGYVQKYPTGAVMTLNYPTGTIATVS